MAKTVTGNLSGTDLSKMGDVTFGAITVESKEGLVFRFQITNGTEGIIPKIGSIITVEYTEGDTLRALRVVTLERVTKREKIGSFPIKQNQSENALERGHKDILVICIFQIIISMEYFHVGALLTAGGSPQWAPYLYLSFGTFYLIIAGGLFLMSSWAYVATLVFNLITGVFLWINPIYLVLPYIVVLYMLREEVRLYYE